MYKLILLSLVFGSYMFAGIHGDSDILKNQSSVEKFNLVTDTSDDDYKIEAGRRRGKGQRGRKRGNGLR